MLLNAIPQVGVNVNVFTAVVIVGEASLPLYCQPLFAPKFQVYPVIPVAPFETVNVIGVVAPHEIDVAEALIIGIFSITILLIESASIY